MDDIFIGILGVLAFGAMSCILMLAGLKRLKLLEKAEIDTIGHFKSSVATFQIIIGAFGFLFTLCQGFILIREIFALL